MGGGVGLLLKGGRGMSLGDTTCWGEGSGCRAAPTGADGMSNPTEVPLVVGLLIPKSSPSDKSPIAWDKRQELRIVYTWYCHLTSPKPPEVGFLPSLIAFKMSVAFHFAYFRFSCV